MSAHSDELIIRIKARKRRLEADLARLRLEGNASKNGAMKQIEEKIEGIAATLQQAGENFTDPVAEEMHKWLR